ncbi:MAG: hypothetical protein MJA29_00150, partial [Candidatus Omnitrophica bacterium]|nr:hypothetical protein [Candidatus Omnitrophota bacterium]
MGALAEGNVYLYVEKDPSGTPDVSAGMQVLVSEPNRAFETGHVTLPTGTGAKTLYTPTISNVKAYVVMWDGCTADNTTQQNTSMGMALVSCDNDDHAAGIVSAAT